MGTSLVSGNPGINSLGRRACAAALAIAASAAAAGPLAYVANGGAGSITVFDTATDTVVGKPIAVGFRPSALVSNHSGSRVYVANAFGNSVSVIDGASQTVIATIDGLDTADGMLLDPSESLLYVVTEEGVREIDTATNALVGDPLPTETDGSLCMKPIGSLAADRAFHRLYLPVVYCLGDPYNNDGELTVIDLDTRTAIATFEIGQFPQSIALSPDDAHAYLANWLGDTVAVVDTAALALESAIPLPAGAHATAAVVDPTGRKLYVVEEGPDTLVTFDTTTFEVIGDAIALGLDPAPLELAAGGREAYVANLSEDSVSHVDLDAQAVLDTVPTGDFPVAVVVAGKDAIFADGFDRAPVG